MKEKNNNELISQFWPFYSKNQGINLQQKFSKTPQIFRTKTKRPIHRSVELKK
jgi:hypothetical protein